MMPIYLASASPRRLALLKQIGLLPQVVASTFVESEELLGEPQSIAVGYALGKAKGALPVPLSGIVIGADTVVHLNGQSFGKPRDEHHAREILSQLSGRVHQVVTGIAIVDNAGRSLVDYEETAVQFRQLTQPEIMRYAKTKEPMDKAGAYGIQGFGSILVQSIMGCYTNVVGLPLPRLHQLLKQWGVDLTSDWG